MGQQQPQSGGQPGQQQPQDGQNQPQQGQTPQGSQKLAGEQQRQDGEREQQRPQDGERPSGNREDPPPTPQRAASAAPEDATGRPVPVVEDVERWGDLPVHLREVFRNGVSEEMPARYRDWIEAYYRRLNERSDGR